MYPGDERWRGEMKRAKKGTALQREGASILEREPAGPVGRVALSAWSPLPLARRGHLSLLSAASPAIGGFESGGLFGSAGRSRDISAAGEAVAWFTTTGTSDPGSPRSYFPQEAMGCQGVGSAGASGSVSVGPHFGWLGRGVVSTSRCLSALGAQTFPLRRRGLEPRWLG